LLRSMTGYGHGSVESRWGVFDVTVKSLNHRFCSIVAHLPELFEPYEIRVQEVIKSYVSRGRIEYRLDWKPAEGVEPQPAVNSRIVESYLSSLRSIADKYHLEGCVDVQLISRLPGVFSLEKDGHSPPEEMWGPISEASEQALKGLVEMREREGRVIQTSIAEMLRSIENLRGVIEALGPERIDRARRRIRERVEEVLGRKELDETRMLMEVALLAERWDISEELLRIKSHISQFDKTIEGDGVSGRRLNFLLQELLREVNTISSKAYDVEISHRAVEIKEILEQIREQAENIE
jgi:uncharacterized protein (TIGR00255 family)